MRPTSWPRLLSLSVFILQLLLSPGLGAAQTELEPITSAAAVRALREEDARQAFPVKISGIYLGEADPEGIAFVIHDRGEGLYVQGPAEQVAGLSRGDFLEIEGVTCPGGFAPYVVAHRVTKVGRKPIPEPLQVTLDDLNAGQMDAKWVEFTGIVRSVEPKAAHDLAPPPPGTLYPVPAIAEGAPGSKVKLKIASGTGRVTIQVNEDLNPEAYIDAEVRIRGLCFNLHNNRRQFVRAFVQVPRGAEFVVTKPPPAGPFQGTVCPVSNLMQFHQLTGKLGHRVRVQGVVLHHEPGVAFWLRDHESSVRIASSQTTPLNSGDEVDVVGFPVLGSYTASLEDGVFRQLSSQGEPAPRLLESNAEALQSDANLVQLDARIAEVRRFADGVSVTLEWQGTSVRARMRLRDEAPTPESFAVGAQVRVKGICLVTTDVNEPLGGLWAPRSFELLIRSEADLATLSPPPWWSAERVVYVLAAFLALALVLVAVVITGSRRRLREQEHRRAMAETEFTAILSERNRVARDIHDTLSQSLSAISVQLELARNHAGEINQATRHRLAIAHQLTREALAEARESIWNMRSHVLEKVDLADALQGILFQATDGTGIDPRFAVEGESRRLPPIVENNLLRMGQEAITNAVKHAIPRRIALNLKFEGRTVTLSVEDDGVGFVVGAKPEGERRSYGLVGMGERADLLGGKIQIDSTPGKGTSVSVVLSV